MPQPRRSRGFSLIELLVVVSIIVVLLGLLLPAIGVVRERSRNAAAVLLVGQVQAAMTLYRGEDPQRRFPPARADRALLSQADGNGVADLLAVRDLGLGGERSLRLDPVTTALIDPWGQEVMYELDAHSSGDGVAVMPADGNGDRLRVPQDVADWNPPRGQPAVQTVPFAYVWSWGRPGTDQRLRTHAGSWIYPRQTAALP